MSDVVQQIKDKLSIIDVVSSYVELHKAGKNFKGKSPFAAEKTPSFYVSPDRGMYYCFSTSQGGDMFNFVQIMEGVDFKEALKILAGKAGVELIPENPQKRSERERWYAALEAATIFYSDLLTKEVEALDYLKRRGVKSETIAKWRIGFAPGPPKYGWRDTKDKLEAENFKRDELFKVGLIKSAEGGKEPFDVFRDRIMFPMAEPSGKIVAFSGRILHPDEKSPKYVNSPETELYKKSELLFGYDKAKNGIRTLGFSLIVEGQFDVVMCHQAGYGNTVAVSGTALTLHHVQLLERLSDKVVLALDADKAGIAAMKKAANLMLKRGLDVKVAEMPMGNDPADMISSSPVEFKKVIGKSVHVIEFLLHLLRREISDDRAFKLKTQHEVYPFILLLPSRVDQYAFAEIVAKETGVPVDVVWYEIEHLRQQTNTTNYSNQIVKVTPTVPDGKPPANSDSTYYKAYVFLLAAMEIVEEELAKRLQTEISQIKVIAEIDEPDTIEISGLIFSLEQQFSDLPKLAVLEEIIAKLNQFKVGLIRKQLLGHRMELQEMEKGKDDARFESALVMVAEYEKKLREPHYVADKFFGV